MDIRALKTSWAQVAAHGGEVPHFFYSHLFLSHPELREMFPISMASQRDKLVGAPRGRPRWRPTGRRRTT